MSKKTTIFVQQEETFVRRRQTVIKVEASYVQLYKNIRNYTLALSPGSPIDMMLFFITKMSDNNGVQVNKQVIQEYIASLPKPITERTFFRTVKILINNNVLLPLSRGEYKMNPAIVWQGDIGTRLEHIKFLEEGGMNVKPNETLLLDKVKEHDGKETVRGDENVVFEDERREDEEGIIIDFGFDQETIDRVNEEGVRQEVENFKKMYPATEEESFKLPKLNTNGREQGQWDTPLEYPKPKLGDFKA